MSVYLGIDIGSSSIKGGVLHLDSGAVEHVRQKPFPDPVPGLPAHWFEVEPAAIVRLTRQLVDQLADLCEEVDGIVFSSQMGGVVLTDEHCQPVSRYLSWRDQRVLSPASPGGPSLWQELQQRCSAEDLALVGNELRPGSAVSLLYALHRSGTLPEQALAMNLGDFVVAQLCGTPPRTEPTMALGSLNLQTRQIHRDWLTELGCGHLHWPDVVATAACVGHVRSGAHRIPCFPAVGDHQCALLGAGLQEGELSLNISTGSQVSLLTSMYQPGPYQTRPFFDGRYLNTITHLPAGRSLNALVDLLCELSTAEGGTVSDPWASIAAAVDRTPHSDLDVNLAFFAGSMGDHGHIANIRLDNLTVGHLFVAAFRNMADNYAECAGRLSPQRLWQQVVLSGGLPQKLPRLRQLLAERFPGPLRTTHVVDEALEGLLQLARQISTHADQSGVF